MMGSFLNIAPPSRSGFIQDTVLVGIADSTIFRRTVAQGQSGNALPTRTTVVSEPERVTIPVLAEVREPYLEIREIATSKVISVVELLSPKNKRSGEGRQQYLQKRQAVLNSQTHLVEIDLLRTGEPMPVEGGRTTDYQIMVSRSPDRPVADRYPFNLEDPIPCFYLPLQVGDEEPIVDLGNLLHQACEETAIDLVIDYAPSPTPPLSEHQTDWLKQLPSANSSNRTN